MQKRFLILLIFFTSFFRFYSSAQTESAIKTASFGVFSSTYDFAMNEMYSDFLQKPQYEFFSGITDDNLNIDGALMLGPLYASLRYFQKITVYKGWPQNMTDETVELYASLPNNWNFRARYYDFCYSQGKGVVKPGFFLGHVSDSSDETGKKLRVSFGSDLALYYPSANDIDIIQLFTTVKVDYSVDAIDGAGFSYTIAPSWAGPQNITSEDDIPTTVSFTLWTGKSWELEGNSTVGARPNIYMSVNGVNPTANTNLNVEGCSYNTLPEFGNFEMLAQIPLSICIRPLKSEKISLLTSLMIGFYYASFNHLDENTTGGYNAKGWVPQTGIGFGGMIQVNRKCSIQAGIQFIRMPQQTQDSNINKYDAEKISASNIAQEPISISIHLRS